MKASKVDLDPEKEASQSNQKKTFFKKFLNWMGIGRKKKKDEEDEEDEEELYTWIALRIHQEMRMNHKSFPNKKLFLPEFEMLDDARNLYMDMENPDRWWRASIEEMFDLEQDPNTNLTTSSNQKKDSKLEKKNQAKKNKQQKSQADRDSNVKEKENKNVKEKENKNVKEKDKKTKSTPKPKRKKKEKKTKDLFKAFLQKVYGHCPLQFNLLDYNSTLLRGSDIPLVLRRHAQKKVQNGSFSSGVQMDEGYLEARIDGLQASRLIAECDYEDEKLLEFVLTNSALMRTSDLLELPEKDEPNYLDEKEKWECKAFYIEPHDFFDWDSDDLDHLIMYQMFTLHKMRDEIEYMERENLYRRNQLWRFVKNPFLRKKSIGQKYSKSGKKNQNDDNIFLLPEHVLSTRHRRKLRILMCFNTWNKYPKNTVFEPITVPKKTHTTELMKLKLFLWPNFRLEDLACMNRYCFNASNGSRFAMLRIRMYPQRNSK